MGVILGWWSAWSASSKKISPAPDVWIQSHGIGWAEIGNIRIAANSVQPGCFDSHLMKQLPAFWQKRIYVDKGPLCFLFLEETWGLSQATALPRTLLQKKTKSKLCPYPWSSRAPRSLPMEKTGIMLKGTLVVKSPHAAIVTNKWKLKAKPERCWPR